ncbi:MAG: hypothetical protein KAU83_12410, partial [Bacteroidales bacterium]|nr:hypothetical protein [Bacteroidales bacterium]
NTSVVGNFSFNGGWMNNGLTISGGDIYAQTAYFYNITSLNVTKQDLTIVDDLIVYGNTELKKNLTVDTDTLFVDSNSGRVGIGTTAPSYKLDVNGNMRVSDYIDFEGELYMNTGLIHNIGHANTDFTTGGGLNIAGNVGIGTTSPGAKLDINLKELKPIEHGNLSGCHYIDNPSG